MAPKIPDRLYTIPDLARLTSSHERTIRRHIEAGLLTCLRLGRAIRFTPEQVARYLRGRPRLAPGAPARPREAGR